MVTCWQKNSTPCETTNSNRMMFNLLVQMLLLDFCVRVPRTISTDVFNCLHMPRNTMYAHAHALTTKSTNMSQDLNLGPIQIYLVDWCAISVICLPVCWYAFLPRVKYKNVLKTTLNVTWYNTAHHKYQRRTHVDRRILRHVKLRMWIK